MFTNMAESMHTTSNRLRVCLIGDSYISGVEEYMKSASDLTNFRLDYNQFQIYRISSKDGLTIDKLSSLVQFEQIVPDICFIQVGGNDIGRLTKDRIVDSIIAFAEYLLFGIGIRRVIIGQLLRRNPQVVSSKYNETVIGVNIKLDEKVKTKNENIVFWKHRGFWKDFSYLGRDGVCLKNPKHRGKLDPPSPMHKYWRSIRNSLISHSKTLRTPMQNDGDVFNVASGNSVTGSQIQDPKVPLWQPEVKPKGSDLVNDPCTRIRPFTAGLLASATGQRSMTSSTCIGSDRQTYDQSWKLFS